MPPATQTTLTITDGVTTLNLVDGDNYFCDPNAVQFGIGLPSDDLRAGPPNDDGVTTLRPMIRGGTANTTTQVLENLRKLIDLLNQAARWSRGDRVAPVRLRCLPIGSNAVEPWETLILGWSGRGIELPDVLLDTVGRRYIPDVQLTLRHNQWHLPGGQGGQELEGDTLPVGYTQEARFGSSVTELCPLLASIGYIPPNGLLAPNFILIASRREKIQNLAATATTSADGWTSSASAAARSFSAQTKKVTSAPNAYLSPIRWSIPAAFAPYAARFAVFAAVQTSPDATWRITTRALRYSYTLDQVRAEVRDTYPSGAGNPYYVNLGTLALPADLPPGEIELEVRNISDGTATIEIDRIILFALDETSFDLALRGLSNEGITTPAALNLVVSNDPLTQRRPRVEVVASTSDIGSNGRVYPVPTRGSTALLTTGDRVALCWLVNDGGAAANTWRIEGAYPFTVQRLASSGIPR